MSHSTEVPRGLDAGAGDVNDVRDCVQSAQQCKDGLDEPRGHDEAQARHGTDSMGVQHAA